jgi:hypothetical protein
VEAVADFLTTNKNSSNMAKVENTIDNSKYGVIAIAEREQGLNVISEPKGLFLTTIDAMIAKIPLNDEGKIRAQTLQHARKLYLTIHESSGKERCPLTSFGYEDPKPLYCINTTSQVQQNIVCRTLNNRGYERSAAFSPCAAHECPLVILWSDGTYGNYYAWMYEEHFPAVIDADTFLGQSKAA